MLVKVKDRKTGKERTVTQKAYAAMGPKVYEKLGFVNDDGTEIAGSPNSKTPQAQVSRSVRNAVPVVVVKSQLVAPESVKEPEPEQEEQASEQPVKERRKPGPKPKNQPAAEESISSNSTTDEQ